MLKKIKTNKIYQDAWLEFFQDEVSLPDGSTGTYAYAKRKNGVGVVVVSRNGKILLHKEHRYVINDFSWEVQGGGIDEGESLTAAAVRELKEEAGIVVPESTLIKLGSFYPLHSFNTEKVSLFMVIVDDEEVKETAMEASEHLEEHNFYSFDEVYDLLESGKINDAMTANAVQLAMRKFKTQFGV